MITKPPTQSQNTDNADRPLLLIGDDGRMARLLGQGVAGCQFQSEAHALQAIVRLGRDRHAVVLLNIEHLGDKTAQAVAAMRLVAPAVPVLLYGPAYGEVYAQAALRAGAQDYLVWPIPVGQLRRQLNGQVQVRRQDASAGADGLMAQLRQLALLIPQGQAALIAEAEKVLARELAVPWVKIQTGSAAPAHNKLDGNTISMRGPDGIVGQMTLAPTGRGHQSTEAANLAAEWLVTLLHLAQRDEHLRYLATVDELTGAHNRRYLEYFLRHLIGQGSSKPAQATLLVFDIDGFKYFNDTYGHGAGDQILCQATRLTRRCCREHDVVARIGGDEFAVLFWDTGQRRKRDEDANAEHSGPARQNDRSPDGQAAPQLSHPEMALFMSNRFRRMMHTSEFPSLGPDARGTLTISGGLARYPQDATTVEEMLARADEALLSAKRSGKNRIYLVGQPSPHAGD